MNKIEKEVACEDIGNYIDKGPITYKGVKYDFNNYYYGQSELGSGYVMLDEEYGREVIKGVVVESYVTIDFSNNIPVIIPEE